MSTEGIHVRFPLRPTQLQVWQGARARDAGQEGAAVAVKESCQFLQSDHPWGRPPWPACIMTSQWQFYYVTMEANGITMMVYVISSDYNNTMAG